jgi:hypothetical protein
MKRVLNPTVALITFAIGVAIATVWQMSPSQSSIQDASAVPAAVEQAPAADLETENYAVYSALIKDMYLEEGVKLLVIQNQDDCQSASTESEAPKEKVEEMRRHMEEWATGQMPALKHETIDEFHKSRKCNSLSHRLDVPVRYVLVNDKDLNGVFLKGEFDRAWRRFYAKYRDSSGIISFSNIGFNPEMNQAFVYTGRVCGGLCGMGYFVLLTKDLGRWKVESKICTWVS